MADLEKQFADAALNAKKLPAKPDNDTLLKLYAFYKQGTEGDVHGEQPGFMDFVGRAKYEAWAALKGDEKDKSKHAYIDLVKKLQTKAS